MARIFEDKSQRRHHCCVVVCCCVSLPAGLLCIIDTWHYQRACSLLRYAETSQPQRSLQPTQVHDEDRLVALFKALVLGLVCDGCGGSGCGMHYDVRSCIRVCATRRLVTINDVVRWEVYYLCANDGRCAQRYLAISVGAEEEMPPFEWRQERRRMPPLARS